MSEITHFFDTICAKVQEKNQLGFGISSPHAKVLDAAVKGFEAAVVKTGVIPSEWDHKSSIGKGNLASVVWVVFLPPGQTAQDGIYIACCFGKSGNGLVAGCAISNTSKAKYHYVPTVERKTPVVDVDGTRPGTHYNNGYVNPQEFLVAGFDEDVFLKHLKDSVAKCKECLNMHATTHETPSLSLKSHEKLQVITYGAPGTGKSHQIDGCTNESNSIRVTFHPDTDYAAFVGAYKPTMDEQEQYALDATGKTHKIEAKEKVIGYSFVPQAFMKAYVEAWKRYTNAGLQDDAKTYYLVIEEINRGNCAQIFGDLFQLLDRADNGFSAYAITPDDDIQKFLEKDKDYKLVDIPLIEDIKKPTEDGEKVIATAEDVKTGKKLVLPPNLCIWATMNTSDQSLFPIDSAFKRRWEWEYVPIEDAGKGWKIDIDGVKYIWWSFLEKINDVIATETSSEDKQLGYFFVKAKDKVIDAKTFVSKVIFYLWGDVFKDNLPEVEAFQYTFTKEGKANKRPIRFADFYHPETDNTKDQWRDKLLISFLDALAVEKDAPAPNASGTPDASGQGSANADGGVAEAGE